jgi:uncharacterized NAD-dependent epimerase/dehydratase family protein
MCHDQGRRVFKAFDHAHDLHPPQIPTLREEIAITEGILGNTSGGRVAAIALMAMGEDPVEETRQEAIVRSTMDVPVADVFSDGPAILLDAVMTSPMGVHKGGGDL